MRHTHNKNKNKHRMWVIDLRRKDELNNVLLPSTAMDEADGAVWQCACYRFCANGWVRGYVRLKKKSTAPWVEFWTWHQPGVEDPCVHAYERWRIAPDPLRIFDDEALWQSERVTTEEEWCIDTGAEPFVFPVHGT
jgi:hypothetical protein